MMSLNLSMNEKTPGGGSRSTAEVAMRESHLVRIGDRLHWLRTRGEGERIDRMVGLIAQQTDADYMEYLLDNEAAQEVAADLVQVSATVLFAYEQDDPDSFWYEVTAYRQSLAMKRADPNEADEELVEKVLKEKLEERLHMLGKIGFTSRTTALYDEVGERNITAVVNFMYDPANHSQCAEMLGLPEDVLYDANTLSRDQFKERAAEYAPNNEDND